MKLTQTLFIRKGILRFGTAPPPFTPTMIYLGMNFTSLIEGVVLGFGNFACGPQLTKE
jgi:hypothetical protein